MKHVSRLTWSRSETPMAPRLQANTIFDPASGLQLKTGCHAEILFLRAHACDGETRSGRRVHTTLNAWTSRFRKEGLGRCEGGALAAAKRTRKRFGLER
jgi:hypothetical protein